MLDPDRNYKTTYRVAVYPGGLYEVSTYPKAPGKIAVASYRFDLLPQWLQEAMHLLDWAHPEDVKGLGRKVGDKREGETYWIEGQDGPPMSYVSLRRDDILDAVRYKTVLTSGIPKG